MDTRVKPAYDAVRDWRQSQSACHFEQNGSKPALRNRNLDSMWSHPVHAGPVRPSRKPDVFEASMNAEIDYDLTPDQWEALKARLTPPARGRVLNRAVVEQLIALRLVAEAGDGPAITPKGRSVLLRGSP